MAWLKKKLLIKTPKKTGAPHRITIVEGFAVILELKV